VQAVFTEDSDLLAYGTGSVFFKMDPEGNGDLIELRRVPEVSGMEAVGQTVQFLDVCILAGCDYLSSLPGIGVKKAAKLLAAAKGSVEGVVKALQSDAVVPPGRAAEYLSDFQQARAGFLTHVVYDPPSARAVRFSDSVDLTNLTFDDLPPPHTASAIASGGLHPVTLQPYTGEFDSNISLAGGKRARDEGPVDTKKQATLLQQWSVKPADKKPPPTPAAAPSVHMEVGARVRRNPLQWKWGDQDGGDGRLGTVLNIARGTVRVRWDARRQEARTYRYGIGGVKEVQVVQSAAAAQKEERAQPKLSFSAAPAPAPAAESSCTVPAEAGGGEKKLERMGEEDATHLELRSRFWFEFSGPERKVLTDLPINTPPPLAAKSPKAPKRPLRRVEDLVGYSAFAFAYPEEDDGSIAETLSEEESEESESHGVKEVPGEGSSESGETSAESEQQPEDGDALQSLDNEASVPEKREDGEDIGGGQSGEEHAAHDTGTPDNPSAPSVQLPESPCAADTTLSVNPFLRFALGKKGA